MKHNKLLLPLVAIMMTTACLSCGDKAAQDEAAQTLQEPKFAYGICIDTLITEECVVCKREIPSKILQKRGVSYNTIDFIAKKYKKNVFDITKIKVGNKYTFIKTNDSLHTPLFWIYEIDKVDFAVFSLTDSLTAWIGHKEVTTTKEYIEGEITSSLWNAMADAGGDQNITLQLSDIYAWTVDFFGIQKGDKFKVLYDQQYIEGEKSGIGTIWAAELTNDKVVHKAYYFEHGGRQDYFDENGENLRKAFLKAPLNYRRISSTFSNGRYHPVLKIVRPHHGVDYAAAAGTPVQSIGDGTVIEKGFQAKGGGNYLKIKHNSVYTTTYMHLKGFAKGISKGTKVKQGQIIGYVGSTGISTGPHLDFRMQKNGTYIDPLKFKSPSAPPVDKNFKEQFDADVKRCDSIMTAAVNQ
ncbi:MAG: M23 family metallopeptidase [Bacteroidales bacterium]|nr:M23 family metallopeptidase [Bacteroidales bacterium]